MLRNVGIYILSIAIILTIGCSVFQPVKVEPITTYALTGNTNVIVNEKQRGSKNIVVSVTKASPGYATDQMVYVKKPYQLEYYTKNKWVQPPAKMLQPLIMKALQTSGNFHAVTMAPFFGMYDYRLDTELLKLQQEFTGNTSVERLEMSAQLVRASDQKIVATRNFVYVIPVREYTPYGGVIAANQAVNQWLIDLKRFHKKAVSIK